MSNLDNFETIKINEIVKKICEYLVENFPSNFTVNNLPCDISLLKEGIIDSAGVIELLMFVETTWDIEISDEDITTEKMGSINKMAGLVATHLSDK